MIMMEPIPKSTNDAMVDVVVDAVLFTVDDESLKVLLITRERDPFKGIRALPGVFVHNGETLAAAALRALKTKVCAGYIITAPYMEQLYTFGDPGRDPRGRIISVTYLCIARIESIPVLVPGAGWFAVNELPLLAFDHDAIVRYAIQRLRWKIEYSTAAFALLSLEFTIANIQAIYEAILGQKFDTANFRKRILARNILTETGSVEVISDEHRVHRPAKLYFLDKKVGDIISIF